MLPLAAKRYIYGVIAAGSLVLALSLANWRSPHPLEWVLYLALAVLASIPKLRLPGTTATDSPSFLFLLFGVVHFSLPEAVLMAGAAATAQMLCNTKKRPSLVQVLFSVANVIVTVATCYLLARVWLAPLLERYRPAVLALVAAQYFVVNTVLVSGVLALLEGKPLASVCRRWYEWSFPYYLIGAAFVGLISSPGHRLGGEAWLILLPLVYLVHFYVGLGQRKAAPGNHQEQAEAGLPRAARIYVLGVLAAGALVLAGATFDWQSAHPARFAVYLAFGLVAATLKVRFPRMNGNISVSFVPLLVTIAEMSFAEAVWAGVLVAAVQSLWKPKQRPQRIQVLFNAACMALSTAGAFLVSRWAMEPWLGHSLVATLIAATLVLYGANTAMLALVLALAERKPLGSMWQGCYFWSCPYYLVGAAAAGLMVSACRTVGWPPSLLVLPLMALVAVSYKVHVRGAGERPQPAVS